MLTLIIQKTLSTYFQDIWALHYARIFAYFSTDGRSILMWWLLLKDKLIEFLNMFNSSWIIKLQENLAVPIRRRRVRCKNKHLTLRIKTCDLNIQREFEYLLNYAFIFLLFKTWFDFFRHPEIRIKTEYIKHTGVTSIKCFISLSLTVIFL